MAIRGWDVERTGTSLGVATGALVRVSGVAWTKSGAAIPWSLVVKLLRPPTDPRYAAPASPQSAPPASPQSAPPASPQPAPPADDPRHWAYWQREPLAYQSGLLAALPGRLGAPRLLLADEPRPDECWLWLEDVPDDAGPVWPLAHYGHVARDLGEFGGTYLGARPLPEYPWLSDAFFRKRIALAEREHGLGLFWRDETWRHPLLVGRFPPGTAARLARIWQARGALLDALDRVPRTLVHGDAHRNNLRARRLAGGTYQTVALDWASLGRGPLGADLTDLTIGVLTGAGGDSSPALPDALFAAYAGGLRDSGWSGDEAAARRGFAITMALAGISRLYWTVVSALDGRRGAALEAGGRSLEAVLQAWATSTARFLDLGDEALTTL